MKNIQLKLSAFVKGKPRADYFEPMYINPDGMNKEAFLEECSRFWDEAKEFIEEREE
jgi:hypothetical protein